MSRSSLGENVLVPLAPTANEGGYDNLFCCLKLLEKLVALLAGFNKPVCDTAPRILFCTEKRS